MCPRLDPQRSFRPLLEALEARALLSVCTVDRLTDVGEGKGMAGDLRYCIGQAQDGDTIQFTVKGIINLSRSLPDLTRSIVIEGPGANFLTVRRDTGGNYRIFTVLGGATISIAGLTISNGYVTSNGGGGIFVSGASLIADGIVVSGNTTTDPVNGGGGIIDGNGGTVTLLNSAIVNNTAAGVGGGLYHYFGSTLTLVNTTVSGNTAADWDGGAIWTYAPLTLLSCTLTNNAAVGGGGIAVRANTTVSMRSTILAGNTASSGHADLSGALSSSSYNLIGNTQGGNGFTDTDLLNVNPLFGPLQDNGGPTPTHALLPGSPAIDAGDNTDAPEFDQRGLPRVTGNVIDLGAFEVQPGLAAAFYLAAPESTLSGVPFDLFLIAYDADGYLATTYTGTVAFYSTDAKAVLPEPYTFTEADTGLLYLPESGVLFTEGLQEVWAYDVDTFAFGLAYVEVFPGSVPGGGLNLPWLHGPDAAALLGLLLPGPAWGRP